MMTIMEARQIVANADDKAADEIREAAYIVLTSWICATEQDRENAKTALDGIKRRVS